MSDKRIAEAPKKAPKVSKQSPVTDNLADFCMITRHAQQAVNVVTGKTDGTAQIERGWTKAYRAHRVQPVGPGRRFAFAVKRSDGTEVWFEMGIKPSRTDEKKPFFTYAIDQLGGEPREYTGFRDFAYAEQGDRRNVYRELARSALPEPWSFTDPNNLDLLERYINSTFLHVEDEGKIAYASDEDGKMAVFSTGLVNKSFQDIYCFCVPNDRGKPWRVDMFCTRGSGHAGKRLQRAFGNKPPERACYFTHVTDIIYDGSLDLVPDYDHLMRRLYRININALRTLMFRSNEALLLIEKAAAKTSEQKRREALKGLEKIVEQDDALWRSMRKALADACAVAQARARYMYSSALPAWNARRSKGGRMYFCLPLCLVDPDRVDVVLVVHKVEASEPYYEGATLYTLQMAYADARAVQRVDGLMGWIGGAFPPVADDNGAPRKTSAFASTVAGEFTPPMGDEADADRTQEDAPKDSAVFAELIACDPDIGNFVVRPGDTVGVFRRNTSPAPAIELPEFKTFNAVSQHQGTFTYDSGIWHFAQEGRNRTQIFHIDGSTTALSAGQAAELHMGDELSFANSCHLRFKA